jgi:hypothetical protein
MRTLLLFTALLLMPIPVSAQGPARNEKFKQYQITLGKGLRAKCRSMYQKPEAQKKCFKDQISAGADYQELISQYPPGHESREVISRCHDRWINPDASRVDFKMALQCVKDEIEMTHNYR